MKYAYIQMKFTIAGKHKKFLSYYRQFLRNLREHEQGKLDETCKHFKNLRIFFKGNIVEKWKNFRYFAKI